MSDPFKNTEGIPVGQDAENLALTVARVGAMRVGAARLGFVGAPADVADVHDIGTAGSVSGAGYGWRDRHLPDPPTNVAPTLTVPGDQFASGPLTFSSGNGNQIIMGDADSLGQIEQLGLSVTLGVLTLASVAGLVIAAGANGTATMTIRGSVAAINAAIDGLVFTPGFGSDAVLELVANDLGATGSGGPLTASASVNITVDGG